MKTTLSSQSNLWRTLKNHFTVLLLLCWWPGAAIAQAQTPGTVLAWGGNSAGQTTVPIAAQSEVTAITAGADFTLALKSDGSVVAWGANTYGQTTVPVEAQGKVVAIAAGGFHSTALMNDGSVLAWGRNDYGQTNVPAEAQAGVTAIAVGMSYSVALKSDGSVLAWGRNNSGQTNVPFAAQRGVTAIAAGSQHVAALKNDGSVVVWGYSNDGQTNVPIAAQSDVAAIAAGGFHTVALKTDGTVVAWGRSNFGQTNVPVAARSGVVAVAAGGSHTVALKLDGSVVAWGNNVSGQTNGPAGLSGVTAIAAGGTHTAIIFVPSAPTITMAPTSQSVRVWTSASFTVTAKGYPSLSYQWRRNGEEIAGATDTTYRLPFSRPDQAGSYTVVVSNSAGSVISSPAVLTVLPVTPGQVVAWGRNTFGQTDVPIAAQSRVRAIAAGGAHTLALKDDGSVVAWGDNRYGQTYVPATAQSGVKAIAAGSAHSAALKHDGSVVVWGTNDLGQMNVPFAAQSGVTAIAAGGWHTVALKTNGSVVAWGYNGSDQTNVPAGLSGVIAIDAGLWHTVALKNDGSVVAWGDYTYGQTTVPIEAGNWVTAIAAGAWHTAALKSEGLVLTWGGNDANRVPGTAQSGVVAIAAGENLTVALKDDGSVVAWGYNTDGQATVPEGLSGVGAIAAGTAHAVALLGVELPAPPSSGRVAVVEAWVHRSSELVNEASGHATKVFRDAAGDIIVTGHADDGAVGQDMVTFKYSGRDGSVLWQRRYNGPANGDDKSVSLAVDRNNNVIVVGDSRGASGYRDWYLAKYAAADGAILWERRDSAPRGGDYVPSAMTVDGNGNVLVTGDHGIVKYAAGNGAMLWTQRDREDLNFTAIATDTSGNVVATGGYGWSGPICCWGGHNDYSGIYTAKYSATTGVPLWTAIIFAPDGASGGGAAVAVDRSGNVVMTGRSTQWGTGADYYTAKYAGGSGALLWEKRYNGPANGHDWATALALDGSGNVVVTGNSSYGNTNDIYTAKYAAASGALLWEKRQAGPDGTNIALAVAVDGSSHVIVAGSSRNSSGRDDYYTVKYAAATGILLWEQRGPTLGGGGATAVIVDGSGDAVVAGAGYHTVKYAAATGAPLWDQQFIVLANIGDVARAVAIDGAGNVVVAGYSRRSLSGFDPYVAKYAAADGALLWEQRYNGPANLYDLVAAVAVDGTGNVVVAGYSQNSDLTYDFHTARYAAADGALLWEKRYKSPANRDDYPSAVAVDTSGNVVVAGTSVTGDASSDFYTAKYAASDGALLWEKRYRGPANSYNGARGVAVDGNGNVVVTGESDGGGYTAKYAAATGNLLWQQYAGGVVALDRNGNVIVTGNTITKKFSAANGILLWQRTPAINVSLQANAVDADGNVVVTGYSDGAIYTAKYAAANGALLWEKRPLRGTPMGVAVDSKGNVVVAGTIGPYGGNSDFYTVKYAAADGALLWEKRYNGPADGADNVAMHPLALGPNGMVVVIGTSDTGSDSTLFGSLYNVDIATVVYRDLPLLSIERVPEGVRLRCLGDPGRVHQVWRAPSATGGGSLVHEQVMPTTGLFEFTDGLAPAGAVFYHLETLP